MKGRGGDKSVDGECGCCVVLVELEIGLDETVVEKEEQEERGEKDKERQEEEAEREQRNSRRSPRVCLYVYLK